VVHCRIQRLPVHETSPFLDHFAQKKEPRDGRKERDANGRLIEASSELDFGADQLLNLRKWPSCQLGDLL
jgi:hypothetical protein